MNFFRKLLWIFLCCTCIALVSVFVACHRNARLSLPALAHYPKLPAVFDEALANAHRRFRENPNDIEVVRGLAHLYQANRLFEEAHTCYRFLAVSSGGLTAHDHYYLADLAQNQGDLATAQTELRQVIEAEPSYLPARLALAETLFKSGKEEEAAQQYDAIVKIEPGHPQASIGLVRIALQHGDDSAAVTRLEKLMADHPEATSGAALLAQILNRRGEIERAQALMLWSQRKHDPIPSDPWMSELLKNCYETQTLTLKFEEYLTAGQEEEALPLLGRVEMLDPKNWIPDLLRGWIQARSRHHAEAVLDYRRALEKGGNPETICPRVVISLLAIDNVSEADAFIANYYQKMPDSGAILSSYADVALRKNDQEKARVLLSKLLLKQPYLYTPNIELAKILWTTNERDEAVKCLKRVTKAYPRDVASRGLLGQYYMEKTEWLAAILPLEEAMALTVSDVSAKKQLTSMLETAYVRIANVESEAGQYSEAANHFEQAIRIAPTDLEAYAGEARISVQLKQFSRAADVLEKIVSLQPDNPTIELSLGDVLYQKGDTAAARQHWEKALRLTPSADADLRQVLQLRLRGEIAADTFK